VEVFFVPVLKTEKYLESSVEFFGDLLRVGVKKYFSHYGRTDIVDINMEMRSVAE